MKREVRKYDSGKAEERKDEKMRGVYKKRKETEIQTRSVLCMEPNIPLTTHNQN